MSRDDTLVANPCTEFEQVTVNRSRVTTTIFHYILGQWGPYFKYHFLIPQKNTSFAGTTHYNVLSVGCVQRCDL